MAGLMAELGTRCKFPIVRHRTVENKNSSRRMHIYFSQSSAQRFVMTEERTTQGREFTELLEEPPGKSLTAIEGECLNKLDGK